MQLPFLPLWLHAKGLTAAEIALVIGGMTASRIVATPLAAFIADKYRNRRMVIICCGFASFFGYLLFASADGFWLIFAAALLVSLCIAPIFPLVEGFSIDGSAVHGLDYGRLRLWASLGFLAGNLGAGALLLYLPIAPLIYLIAAAQAVSALVALLLPADPERDKLVHRPGQAANLAGAARVLMGGSFVVFLAAISLGQASHAMLYAFAPVHWDSLGYGKFAIGSFWAVSIMAEVALFSVSNVIVNRFGPITLIIAGISGGILRWLVMALDAGLTITIILQGFHAISFALVHLGTMHYIRQTVPDGLRNSAQGLYAAVSGGIALSIAIWLSGLLYGSLHGKTYLVMAAISIAALSFALALRRLNSASLAVHEARL